MTVAGRLKKLLPERKGKLLSGRQGKLHPGRQVMGRACHGRPGRIPVSPVTEGRKGGG